jgi:hypothetical protein
MLTLVTDDVRRLKDSRIVGCSGLTLRYAGNHQQNIAAARDPSRCAPTISSYLCSSAQKTSYPPPQEAETTEHVHARRGGLASRAGPESCNCKSLIPAFFILVINGDAANNPRAQ